MRWKGERRSDRIEDRRGMSVGRGGMAIGGGTLLLVVAFALLTGRNPIEVLDAVGAGGGVSAGPAEQAPTGAPADELGQFAAVVLASTEDVWTAVFQAEGVQYQPPTLVLFEGAVSSACGLASSAVGPFYCPPDGKLYLDLGFFQQLEQRFGAPGDFAAAYVISHEVAHHVQNLLGISERVQRAQATAGAEERNALSVRLELQADCLAGVWGHHANQQRKLLEPGDVEEGLRAAAAIGDDMMQSRAGGAVQPESWTHGSSEMRERWLRTGLETGDADRCDTLAAAGI
jgi:predicted metalloprotease